MSRQSSLTLTEELEKIEQSITLTLQEIDHNFSRAHRIVTSSILPIVEQYAAHSHDVWQGSRFWKQFFESSANVSLSGYEEQPSTHGTSDDTVTEESSATTHTTLESSESYTTPSSVHYSAEPNQEDIDLSSLTISPSHSTPRPHAKGKKPQSQGQHPAAFADYPSPYEALRQEVNQASSKSQPLVPPPPAPSTPATSCAVTSQSRDIVTTPDTAASSPLISRLTPTSIPRPSTARKKTDPLLHRVLDRNYRVQATPISNARYGGFQNSRIAAAAGASITPATAARTKLLESTLSSSPNMPEAPELHAEIFSSPVRKSRMPGVSVLTPAKPAAAGGTVSRPADPGAPAGIWDSDDDDLDEDDDSGFPFGQSPPKTMQFHVPQSRLLKTPGTSIVLLLQWSFGANIANSALHSKGSIKTHCGGPLAERRSRSRRRRRRRRHDR
jgi:DASH complex subunit ASK1